MRRCLILSTHFLEQTPLSIQRELKNFRPCQILMNLFEESLINVYDSLGESPTPVYFYLLFIFLSLFGNIGIDQIFHTFDLFRLLSEKNYAEYFIISDIIL